MKALDKTRRMSAAAYRRAVCGGNAEKSYKNRQSNDKGRIFENLIKKGCQYYALHKKAVINKVNEPYICTKVLDGGSFVGRFTGRAEPDFKGVLKGGRAIAFEAKSTQKPSIQRSILTSEQMQWLEEQKDMGALTYVCVSLQDKFFMVPWQRWRDMKLHYGRNYLTAADIPEFEVIFDGSVRFLEYVTVKE